MMRQRKVKLGFIPANRGFFSDALAAKMRKETIKVLREAGATVVVPSSKDTKIGCVETLDEAIKVGRMFRESQVEGIVVSAVNFGDEQGVAITLKESGLRPLQTAYMGDDWLDLPLLVRVGFSASVADGAPEVREVVHYISKRNGGKGAVREVCDLIIDAKGLTQSLLANYLK